MIVGQLDYVADLPQRIFARGPMTSALETDRLRHLLRIGRELVAEHDTEAVLDRILNEARAITGARYAALGVLNKDRTELERFVTLGIDAAMHRAIGDLPAVAECSES